MTAIHDRRMEVTEVYEMPRGTRRLGPFTIRRLVLYYAAVLATLSGASLLPARIGASAGAGMVATLLLSLPLAFVYVRTRTRAKYDRSLIATVVILPVIVTALVFVVRDSLALAFSLTGIVAAVRFRNNLKESNDAVYIFGAIGIGFAAGIQALTVAALLSIFLSVLELALWRFDLGAGFEQTYTRLCTMHSTDSSTAALAAPAPLLLASPQRIGGALHVRLRREPGARRAVQRVLEEHARRWKLASKPVRRGAYRDLEYSVQLKRRSAPARLQEELRDALGPVVVAIEWMTQASGAARAAAAAFLLLLGSAGALPAQSTIPAHLGAEGSPRLEAEVPVRSASRASAAAVEAYAVALEYAHAMVGGNWPRAARVMHPAALEEVKAAARRKARGDPSRWPLSLMPGARTIEAFDAMPPATVFLRVMRLIDAAAPEETAGIVGIEFRDLRVESDSEAVVMVDLMRQDEHGEIDRDRGRITLQRLGERWRVMPETDLKRICGLRR
jgi:hypothetical protein